MAALEREAVNDQFDKLKLKRVTVEANRTGHAAAVCYECTHARVIALLSPGQTVPLAAWGRIFQWFGPPKPEQWVGAPLGTNTAPTAPRWTIYWYANPTPRQFPPIGQPLGPEHVNGGYTSPCSAAGIFIYRHEEATRVLIHELMHAACLDEQAWDIPHREAMVETWAELILVALVAKGRPAAAAELWRQQAFWIAEGNAHAKFYNKVRGPTDYAWRYLNGRAEMYTRLGVALPNPRPFPAGAMVSTRFTHPALGV